MPKVVVDGAKLKCSEGTAPCTLSVLPTEHAKSDGANVATIKDRELTNVTGFVMCTSSKNPKVKMSQYQRAPCQPLITSDWSSGSSFVKLNGKVVLTADSTLSCEWGGTIEVSDPGPGAFPAD